MKSILITGCSSGIGQCTANMLKERGHRVFATARKAEDVAKLSGQGFEAVQLDVNDSSSIQCAVSEVLEKTGGTLDVLINNAGYAQPASVEDLSRDAIHAQFETNLFGLLELTNLILPIMHKQDHGRVISISSVLGLVAMPFNSGAYISSKFALEGLMDCLRMELHKTNIDICLIEPGPIESNFRQNARRTFQQDPALQSSKHKEFYTAWLNRKERKKEESLLTRPPEAVAKKIIHAVESNKPKAHYYVTFATYFLAWARRLLPSSLLDALIRKIS